MNTVIKMSVISLIVALLLSSCLSESNKERSIQSIDTQLVADETNNEKVERIKKIFYTLPSPLEVTMMFKKGGVQYHSDILHPTAKRNDYNNTLSKALNLGVYGADLSYVGLFAKHEAALKYLATSQIMADDLGIGSTFQEGFISRLEENAGNKDTLLKVLGEFFLKNDQYLKDSQYQDLSTYILAASWVEGMYLGTKMVDERKNAEGIKNIIINQRIPLHNVIVLLQNTMISETSGEILKMLGELESVYSGIEGEMSEQEFLIIKSKIEDARSFIINL